MAVLQTSQYIPDWTNVVEHMAAEEAALVALRDPDSDPADIDRKGLWMAFQGDLPIDLRLKSDGTYTAYLGGDFGMLCGDYTRSATAVKLQVPEDAWLGGLPREPDGALLLRCKKDSLLLEHPGLPGGLPVVLSLASTETLYDS